MNFFVIFLPLLLLSLIEKYNAKIVSTEQHFKFNPWKELSEEEIISIKQAFKARNSSVYTRINQITKERIHMNYDDYGKIIGNYNRENL